MLLRRPPTAAVPPPVMAALSAAAKAAEVAPGTARLAGKGRTNAGPGGAACDTTGVAGAAGGGEGALVGRAGDGTALPTTPSPTCRLAASSMLSPSTGRRAVLTVSCPPLPPPALPARAVRTGMMGPLRAVATGCVDGTAPAMGSAKCGGGGAAVGDDDGATDVGGGDGKVPIIAAASGEAMV